MQTSAAASVRRYRLLPESLARAEERVRRRQVIPYLAILGALVVISTILGQLQANGLASFIPAVVITGIYLTYLLLVVPRRTHKTLAKCWDSYSLEIGPDYLLRQQADTPDVRLPFSEITRVERHKGEYVRIMGTRRLHVIGIPDGIEHFDEVWQTVSQLAPVNEHRTDHQLFRVLLTAGFGTGFLVMLWSSSPRIVLPLAVVLAGCLVWAFVFALRSPNVSRKGKRAAWVYLWIMFLVGLKVVMTLSQLRRH